jgi:hypothetical protein
VLIRKRPFKPARIKTTAIGIFIFDFTAADIYNWNGNTGADTKPPGGGRRFYNSFENISNLPRGA